MADLTNMLKAAAAGKPRTPWELTNAAFVGTPVNFFSLFGVEGNPTDIFFKPDGTKMYVIGSIADNVNEYDLSTAWAIGTASYVQSFSVAAEENSPQALFFKPDGTKMYVLGTAGDDVNEYNLGTAWDISTASFLQLFSIAAQETLPSGLFFKPDGTKMYVVGTTGDDVNEYNLGTAWNVSTASYVQVFSVAAQDTQPSGIFFRDDGLKMYITGVTGQDINEYTLGTAWNVSTASYVQVFSVAAQETFPLGLFFKPDGTKMYMIGILNDIIWQYDLSSAWNISTASWTPPSDYFSIVAEELNPSGLFFKPDGTKMYVVGTTGDDVNEYDLSTPWQISTASYLQAFSIAAQETLPSGLFFKPDGTKMYVIGSVGDDVNEYNLGTAWDISTASYLQVFSVVTQESTPTGLFFKPDGTKMYIVGSSGIEVNEYNLGTAWNVSTASFVQVLSVSAQDTSPQAIFFKPDGTKMFIVGGTGRDVNEYDLGTAWNISTATFVQVFSVAKQETDPRGIFIKPDGLKMYIVGLQLDAVWAYDL